MVTAVGTVQAKILQEFLSGSKVLGAVRSILKGRSMSLRVKKTLYQQVIVPMVTYGAESWGLREAERRRLNVFEIKCQRPVVGVTRRYEIRNEEIRRKAGIEETLAEKVDRRVLRWFGHVERRDEWCWPRKVKTVWVDEVQCHTGTAPESSFDTKA